MLSTTKRCGDGGCIGDEFVERDAQGVGCWLARMSCKLAMWVRDGSGRHDAWLEWVVTAGVWYGSWWQRYSHWQWWDARQKLWACADGWWKGSEMLNGVVAGPGAMIRRQVHNGIREAVRWELLEIT
jgi:hypothetical protein